MLNASSVPNAAEKRHGTTAAKQCTNLIMIGFGNFGWSKSFDVGILTAVAGLHPTALKTLAPQEQVLLATVQVHGPQVCALRISVH